jgi:tetratricopeptide (TPR) repeat protein
MRALVFTDRSLLRHAGRFVWLEINRELAQNSEFRKRFPIPGLPTYAIVDAESRTEKVRWVGGMSVGELHLLLDDASGKGDTPPALVKRLARADSLYAVPAYAEAAAAYDSVLSHAVRGWSGWPRVVVSQQFALSECGQERRAVELAHDALPRLGATGAALAMASTGLSAALALPDTAPGRAAAVAEMEHETRERVTDFSYSVAPDDRSGAWISLLDARADARDSVGSHEVAQHWSEFLDAEAAKTRSPAERMVYDSHRLSAYLELGQADRAIPMLEQSQRDAPDDYNPPYRLAIAYRALRRWDDALAAAARADTMMYGPRKLNLYDIVTDVLVGKGDVAGAKRELEEAVRYAESLPSEQQSARRIAAWRKRLAAMN